MRFEELVERAMSEDIEVCKAVQKLYRGDLGQFIPISMYGDRYLLFMENCSGFEEAIRYECNSFYDDGRRVPAFQLRLFPYFTFVLTGNIVYEHCNYMLRVVDGNEEDYSYYPAEMTFGKTLVSKKELVKVLKERGWL